MNVFPALSASRPRRPSSRDLTAADCLRVEAASAHDLRNVFSLHDQRGSLPLLVRCAVRVHQQRETRPVLVFALEREGGLKVVVAQDQGVVLIFSRLGGLDAPTALFPGDTWTRIEWTGDVTRRDWY